MDKAWAYRNASGLVKFHGYHDHRSARQGSKSPMLSGWLTKDLFDFHTNLLLNCYSAKLSSLPVR